MYTTHLISKEEHYTFFEGVWGDEMRRYLLCEDEDGVPVGVVSFSEISRENRTALWAFYSGNMKRRGVGTNMEFLALDYAFSTLDLRKLCGEVLDFNKTVVDFHRKFGFKVEGFLRDHHWTGERFAGVYRIAIFRDDWERHLRARALELVEGRAPRGSLDPGATHETEFVISRESIAAFAEVSGDDNVVHLDAMAARELGFEDCIAHGMLGASIFSRIFGREVPGPGTIYLRQDLGFRRPIYPDRLLKVTVRVVSRVGRRITLETTIRDEQGETLIRGEAEVLAPRVAARAARLERNG